jgi:hypothetical protein
MIAVVVELFGKLQNFGRAEFNAEAAALAAIPIDENLATELASFWRRSALRHVNLEKKRDLANVTGTCCPT